MADGSVQVAGTPPHPAPSPAQRLHPLALSQARHFGCFNHRHGTVQLWPEARLGPVRAGLRRALARAEQSAGRIVLLASHAADVDGVRVPDRALLVHGGPGGTLNLGDAAALDQFEAMLGDTPVCLVLAGVLESVADPRPLLRVMRRVLKRSRQSIAVVSMLDRSLPEVAAVEDSYRRLWTADEATALFAAAAFAIGGGNATFTLRADPALHAATLAQAGLPPLAARLHVLGDPERMDLEVPAREPDTLVLPIGAEEDALGLSVRGISPPQDPDQIGESVLDAVLTAVMLYDTVRDVTYPDRGGMFHRVAQAGRTGLLSRTIRTTVLCGGNGIYAERAFKRFDPPLRNIVHVREKIAFELADRVVYPEPCVQRLYETEIGLRPLGETAVQAFPLSLGAAAALCRWERVGRLLCLAEPGQDVGWWELRDAVVALLSGPGGASSLREIVLTGGPPWDLPQFPAVQVRRSERGAAELAEEALASVGDVLAVTMPGSGTMASVLLRLAASGCPAFGVAGNAGLEALPEPLRRELFCALGRGPVAEALRRAALATADARATRAGRVSAALRETLAATAAGYERLWEAPMPSLPPDDALEPSPVTVVVPIYNRPFAEVEDLIAGLNAQHLPPREVIFVDDGSAEDFAAAHGAAIQAQLLAPARFIRHVRNLGLPGARNTGLAACETPLVCVHDSDNIVANDFLFQGCRTLARQPAFDAVTFLVMNFADGTDWRAEDDRRFRFRPAGDGWVDSLGYNNRFGDALSVYRTAALRQAGGWDEGNRAMWEDMIFFIALCSVGRRIVTVPRFDVLYRTRADSMLRTGSEYDARWHMAQAPTRLSTFEALCIKRSVVAELRRKDALPERLSGRQHLREATIRLSQRSRAASVGVRCAAGLWRLARRTRRWARLLSTSRDG